MTRPRFFPKMIESIYHEVSTPREYLSYLQHEVYEKELTPRATFLLINEFEAYRDVRINVVTRLSFKYYEINFYKVWWQRGGWPGL